MDELEFVRRFRQGVPATADAREAARARLLAVVDAASLGRTAPRLTRRRLAVAVLVASFALAGGVAGSAFGLGDRLLELVAGTPAPPPVTERLVEEATAERITPLFSGKPNVDAERAHGVLGVETSAGPVVLWTVPTPDGPVCYFLEVVRASERAGRPHGASRCIARAWRGITWQRSRVTVAGRSLLLLAGYTSEHVASVSLQSPEGAIRRLPLGERFFLGELPREPVDMRDRFLLIARDTDGREIDRQPVTRMVAEAHDFYDRKLSGRPRTVLETRDSKQQPMRVILQPVAGGETCVTVEVRNGRGTGCGGPTRAPQGIAVYPVLSGSMVYLSGSVGPEIESLELHFQDGEAVNVPISERFVLHDIPRERFQAGKRPIRLVGRNAAGDVVEEKPIAQNPAFAENSSIWRPGEVSP